MAKSKATTGDWEVEPHKIRWVRELVEGLGYGHPIHAKRTNNVDTVILRDPGGTEYVVNRVR